MGARSRQSQSELTSTESRLSRLGHHIRLVENDQLESLPMRPRQHDSLLSWGHGRRRERRGWSGRRTHENNTLVIAKLLIWSRTTSIPRSSDAFSSRMCFLYAGPYSLRARARTVDVLPVPGGVASVEYYRRSSESHSGGWAVVRGVAHQVDRIAEDEVVGRHQ